MSLQLRKTLVSDLDYVLNAESNEENRRFIIPWSREQHLAAILSDAAQPSAQPDTAHLIVQNLSGDGYRERVGYVILAGLSDPNQSIEFRRIVITDKGKGYGRATVELVKTLAFDTYNAHRLWLDVKTQNVRAYALYQSAGFITEGTLRECLRIEQGFDSLIIMSLLRREYEEGK